MQSSWKCACAVVALIIAPSLAVAAEPPTPAPVPAADPAPECSQPAVQLTGQAALGAEDTAVEAAGSCFVACYDEETSKAFGCAEGERFAMDATGHFSRCCLVGGGQCVTSGCTVLASQCNGFAASCGGSC